MQDLLEISFQDIAAFIAVAQTGGFTLAAERLGSNKSSVGKAVQRLEKHLGSQLFQRTTRVVRLTEDGERYLSAALAAAEQLREAREALAANRAEPSGRVKVDLPAGFGRLVLPTLGALHARYPRLVVELALNDRMSDAVGEGWDVVVRVGQLPADSDMTVRRICELQLALYASPAYLAGHAPPSGIADLGAHKAVLFRGQNGRLHGWTLNDHGVRRELSPAPALILTDGHALVEAAAMGYGVAQIMDGFARPYVASGALVQVLPGTEVAAAPVHALIPVGHRMSARTRVVLEHLIDTLRN